MKTLTYNCTNLIKAPCFPRKRQVKSKRCFRDFLTYYSVKTLFTKMFFWKRLVFTNLISTFELSKRNSRVLLKIVLYYYKH